MAEGHAQHSAAERASAAQAAHAVRITVGRLRRRLRELYGVDELTPSQTSVLGRLDKDGPACASDLAVAERVRPQSVATTLGVLELRGLIRRDPDPEDGRRQLVSLSAAGLDLISASRRQREEWLTEAMLQRYTEDERQTLLAATDLLDRLTNS